MLDIQDFRFWFNGEDEVAAFCARAKELQGDELALQVSRVRRAWVSVRAAATRKDEARAQTQPAADLDDLLEEVTLREVKSNFWRRYKLRYPAMLTPSDALISRCYREVDRRLLSVVNIWSVRTLMYQVTTNKKKRKIGEGLYVLDEDTHQDAARTADTYLSQLHTYLLALAIAGSNPTPSPPVTPESQGSDPTAFVLAPWDVLLQYYYRAVNNSRLLPESARVAWLEKHDVAERSIWVSEFWDGTATIGSVVQATFTKRDVHWEVTPDAHVTHRDNQSFIAPPPTPEKVAKPRRDGKGKAGGKGKTGKTAKNPNAPTPGTIRFRIGQSKLCEAFQHGTCEAVGKMKCPDGLHKCGKVLQNGKVCGRPFHGAHKCKQE